MDLVRVCSFTVGVITPRAPSEYSKIIVTFAQNGKTVITKNKSDLELQSTGVKIQLTQAETAMFEAPGVALMQLRAYKSEYDAPGSKCWALNVYPALSEEILS